jgi:hypothetical protein
MTPENAELLAHYAGHLERSLLTGHSPRTYLGAVLACLAWLRDAPATATRSTTPWPRTGPSGTTAPASNAPRPVMDSGACRCAAPAQLP